MCASLIIGATEVKIRYVLPYDLAYEGDKVKFNENEKTFDDYRFIGVYDNWVFTLGIEEREKIIAESKKPHKWPAKKKYDFHLKPTKLFRKSETLYAQAMLLGALQSMQKKYRVVIINVESLENLPLSVRCHAHLGLLYIGTAARLLGHEVVLHDELVQGKCDITKLVRSGDIVGFSLVITGIERGVQLAYQAKLLGAAAVVAGNDAAIFRCNQLLALPGKPFDGIFTSNSLNSWKQFLTEFNGRNVNELNIPEFKTRPGGVQHSNQNKQLTVELKGRKTQKATGEYDAMDGFIVPDFSLFPPEYWETCWTRAQQVYGHKHDFQVRNSTILLAQGCTRTQGVEACIYCSINGVGDIRVPIREHLVRLLQKYYEFGINKFYNTTDSIGEMGPAINELEEIGATFPALTIYTRAQGIATNPQLLDRWLKMAGQLELNIGMDSGDAGILANGIVKSSTKGLGSRLTENEQALLNIRSAGAFLHYSVIFGSPGESRESCERTVDFISQSLITLKKQINMVESDFFWVNHGASCSEVFYSYKYAQTLAATARKSITKHQWWKHFGSQRDTLVVPWATERAWYEFFTKLSLEEAQEFNEQVLKIMESHEGAIGGRAFNPIKEV
ncbi:MAG: hypothetical protein JNK33_04155 [Candidatus Doudnabacteria bacterium]|nr:hypothetical protein [Candidatus Doudnabacteria bacterium]